MKKAFTLIELIFVITIIGLLAAVAVPRFLATTQNARFKPAVLVTREIVRKWNEQYHELQDANISRVVLKNPHIQKYLHELTTNIDKHFVWEVRYKDGYNDTTVFAIGYKTNKLIGGNVHYGDNKPDGTPIETDDTAIGWWLSSTNSKKVKYTSTCIRIKIYQIQVPIDMEHNATTYEVNITQADPTCMTAAD